MKISFRKILVLGMMVFLLSLLTSSIAFGQGPDAEPVKKVSPEPSKVAPAEPAKATITATVTTPATNVPAAEPQKAAPALEPAKAITATAVKPSGSGPAPVEAEPVKATPTKQPTQVKTTEIKTSAAVNPPGQTSNVLLQNTTSTPANVTVNVYKTDGSVAFNATFTLAASGARTVHAGAGTSNDGHLYMNLPSGASLTQQYAMVVSADQRLVATNVNFGAPSAHSIYAGLDSSNTATDILLPSIHWKDAQWSLIGIQNAGPSDATVNISYFDPSGTLINSVINATIKPGASHFRNSHDDVTLTSCTLCNQGVGSMRVTSTNGQPLAVAVEETVGTATSAYEGFPVSAADTNWSLPSIHHNLGGQYSHTLVQNTDAANDATVTVTYYDQAGNQVDQFAGITIPKSGSLTFHTTSLASANGQVYEPLHMGNAGSATVQSTNGVKLVALVVETVGAYPYAYDGFNSTGSGTTVLLPSVHRNLAGQFSHILVQNSSSTTVDNVTITYNNPDGTVANTFSTALAKAGAITFHTTQNVNGSNAYDPAKLGNVGSAKITCDQPCYAVVVETIAGVGGAYNGFKQ